MNHIGVFTSGGDAPGMNACVRAVARTAIYHGLQVSGIRRGYEGMIDGDLAPLDAASVAHIIHRGGTILKSARSDRFRTVKGRQQAAVQVRNYGIDGMVAIGGDGTFTGAHIFQQETGIPFIGIPGTIDNDLYGTDATLGYDTALNTVIEAVDRIRDTADSHDRLFIIEVMGRDAGFIALRSGIASGAEAILIPETVTYIDHINKKLSNRRESKTGGIIIVAEGDDFGGAYDVAEAIKKAHPHFDIRVTVLGHIQRGGSPSAADRVLASRLGSAAVVALKDGKSDCMVGTANNEVTFTPFDQATKHHQQIRPDLLELAEMLSI